MDISCRAIWPPTSGLHSVSRPCVGGDAIAAGGAATAGVKGAVIGVGLFWITRGTDARVFLSPSPPLPPAAPPPALVPRVAGNGALSSLSSTRLGRCGSVRSVCIGRNLSLSATLSVQTEHIFIFPARRGARRAAKYPKLHRFQFFLNLKKKNARPASSTKQQQPKCKEQDDFEFWPCVAATRQSVASVER